MKRAIRFLDTKGDAALECTACVVSVFQATYDSCEDMEFWIDI